MNYRDKIKKIAKDFPVFPVDPSVKKPCRKGQFHSQGTQDPAKIDELWDQWPDARVGIATGSPSGIWAFDVDIDKKKGFDGRKRLSELEKEHGKLQSGMKQKTKRGGFHYIFAYDEQCKFKQGTHVLKPEGAEKGHLTHLDVRTEGGFICIWPTEGYKIRGSVFDVEPAPDWLIDMLNTERDKKIERSNKETPKIVVEAEKMTADFALIDPVNYASREEWMIMMMSAKSGSNGEDWGKDIFLEWSLRDTQTAFSIDPREEIEKQWETLDAHRRDGISYATIQKASSDQRKVNQVNSWEDDEFEEAKPREVEHKATNPLAEQVGTYVYKQIGLKMTRRLVKPPMRPSRPDWHLNADGTKLTRSELNLELFLTEPKMPIETPKRGKNPLFELFGYNELSGRAVFMRVPPWGNQDSGDFFVGKAVEEHDRTSLRNFLTKITDLQFNKDMTKAAVACASRKNSFNPVQDYLEELVWDGESRLETWLIKSGGVEDNVYTRFVSKYMLISLAVRGCCPGSKVDTIPVFEGAQGTLKSSLLRELGGKFFASPEIPFGDKDAEQNLQGKWLIEIAEFSLHNKKQANELKAFATKEFNTLRASYGEEARDWPRRCVICMTLNPEKDTGYLLDVTGNRRMWPIELTKKADLPWITANRDQLFAEAMTLMLAGSQWWPTDEEEKIAQSVVKKRVVEAPRQEIVKNMLGTSNFPHISASNFCLEYLKVNASDSRFGAIVREVAGIFRSLKWEVKSKRTDHNNNKCTPHRVFIRPDEWTLQDTEEF